MAERKFARLWITVLVAILVVSAGNGAWAFDKCQKDENKGDNEKPAGECVNLYGYDVWVNRGVTGLFPDYVGGNSVYAWSISSFNAQYAVGHIDIEIPANIAAYSTLVPNNIAVQIIGKDQFGTDCTCNLQYSSSATPEKSWLLYDKGIGDSSIDFGRYEYDKYVLKLIPAKSGACAITRETNKTKIIKVTFIGKLLFSGPDEFLIKSSSKGGSAEALNLLGPSLSSQATSSSDQPAVRSGESFTLGTTGCKMHLTLNSDGSIAKAIVLPAGEACGDGTTPLPIEKISKTWICDNDGLGNPSNCKPKKYVEQNIMEEDLGSCTYKYTTRTGQTVTKTITGTADCP